MQKKVFSLCFFRVRKFLSINLKNWKKVDLVEKKFNPKNKKLKFPISFLEAAFFTLLVFAVS